jgi:hypothetical protein
MNAPTSTLHITLAAELFHYFVPLLQQGVFVKAKDGGSIKSFLCETLALSPAYAEKRIQTVFIDGKVVDDWDQTTVDSGSTLALSAAAPGLAGAILRRQGPLSTMRRPITYGPEKRPAGSGEGIIGLKLFNLLVGELGPPILEKGILLPREDLESFLKTLPDEFWMKCREATANGKKVDCKSLRKPDSFPRLPFLGLAVKFIEKSPSSA